MNVLEEFWYGNLDPAEYDTSPDPEYKELLQMQISFSYCKITGDIDVIGLSFNN